MYSSQYIPTIDPIIFHIAGPFAIRWYSLAYIAGVIFAWWHAKKLIKSYTTSINEKDIDDFIPWSIITIIVGGRLGEVLIYNPSYYFAHPLDILKTYEGGMSFHGAIIGMGIFSLCFCSIRKIPFLQATDLSLASVSFGLFFGRIANFINGELYGRITDVPWGVVFFTALPEGSPRHPSQLYEAILEGAVLFAITMYYIYKKKKLQDYGFITGLWCALYSIFRYVSEFYREPDGIIDLKFVEVSTGQFLSIIMFIFSLCILFFRKKLNSNLKNNNGY